jgi:chromosome partitioning protein
MSFRVAIANQKGGVGKTTIALNLAGELGKDHDVLMVDLDPQGNLTEASGVPDAYHEDPPSIFNGLLDGDVRGRASDLLVPLDYGMDILPSNIDLTAAEPELTMARRSAERLDMLLEELLDYDFVIVDPPPFLGNLTDNALLACENVLIPALAESSSTRAFELLFNHIDALSSDYPERSIDSVGVVVNRVDVRKSEANKMVEGIQEGFDDVPVWVVRERADIQKAFASQKPLCVHAPNSDQNPRFQEIAEYLEGLS